MMILFDIGGSKTRVAWSSDGQTFSDPILEKTIHHPNNGPHHLIETIEKVAAGRPIHVISGGIAGTLNQDQTMLEKAPHLPDWERYPLAGTLSSHFSCPVHMDNDSALVGLGEAHFGAGQGHDIMVYITISTGVGGVRIVHGEIDKNRQGFEPGHHIVDWNNKTTFEQLVSGSANEARFDAKITEIPQSAWATLAQQAAIGIYNTNLFWSPDCIVLGGSMITKEIGIDIEQIKTAYWSLPPVMTSGPEIKQATLEDFGGLYGAMILAHQ